MLAIESKSMQSRASGGLGIFYGMLNGLELRDRSKNIADHSENKPLNEKSSPINAENAARSFLKVAAANGAAFDRLSRHEFNLWRQLVQTILLLNAINRGSHQDDERLLTIRDLVRCESAGASGGRRFTRPPENGPHFMGEMFG